MRIYYAYGTSADCPSLFGWHQVRYVHNTPTGRNRRNRQASPQVRQGDEGSAGIFLRVALHQCAENVQNRTFESFRPEMHCGRDCGGWGTFAYILKTRFLLRIFSLSRFMSPKLLFLHPKDCAFSLVR